MPTISSPISLPRSSKPSANRLTGSFEQTAEAPGHGRLVFISVRELRVSRMNLAGNFVWDIGWALNPADGIGL